MAGTVPISGNLSMADLADRLTKQEQLGFQQVTGLAIDPTQVRNLVTTVSQENQLGVLTVVAKGAASTGTKVLSTSAYVSGTATDIDLYRQPV
jgi:hypothetical protein